MTLTELYIKQKQLNTSFKIYIDNDEVFTEGQDFTMMPDSALVEALQILGFKPEYV